MGMIANFQPGSIRTLRDVERALEMVMLDLFAGVATPSGGELDYTLSDDAGGLWFGIRVVDCADEIDAKAVAAAVADDDDDDDFGFSLEPSAN